MRNPLAIVPIVLCCMVYAQLACGGGVLWLEAEQRHGEEQGEVLLIDETISDYGAMAKAEASGERFVRMGPKATLPLASVDVEETGDYAVWVRAFPLTSRWVTVSVDGEPVGTTSGDVSPKLIWQRVGTLNLGIGTHSVALSAAVGNSRFAYVDAVALLADLVAAPIGRSAADIVHGGPVQEIVDEFADEDVLSRWLVIPPAGADAIVEAAPAEDGGALRIHNGAGKPYSLTSREFLDVKPGDQVTVRVRSRKGQLMEQLSVELMGVDSFSPQLYRDYQTVERTWLVPPGLVGCVRMRLNGRGGGDTFVSLAQAFRRDPPLSSFATGRFLPRPDLHREGRLFEIERYVVNQEAFSEDTDEDADGSWSLCRLSREDNSPYFSRGTVLKSDSVVSDRASPAAGCAPLHVRVGPLEPGPYQVHLNVPGRTLAYSPDGTEWRKLNGTSAPEIGVVTLTEPTFEFWLDDRYSEPGNPGPTYVDFIRFMPLENAPYTMAPIPVPKSRVGGTVERDRIKLTVANSNDRARAEPVRSGVPVPQGRLTDAEHVQLLDEDDQEVPLWVQCTGRWPDGSVKWLLLDFEVDVPAESRRMLSLAYGNAAHRAVVPNRVSIERRGTILTVDTDAARVVFDGLHGDRFQIFRAGAETPAASVEGLTLEAVDGRRWQSSLCEDTDVVIEEATPFRATVRLRGRCSGNDRTAPFAFDCRVHLFAGRAEALLESAFFATEAETSIDLERVSVRVNSPASAAHFGVESGPSSSVPLKDKPRLLQTAEEVYGDGGPFRYTLRTADGRVLTKGERAPGWLRLGDVNGTATLVCLPDFWQQFPKALACDEGGATVELWAKTAGGKPFTAHAGAGKSHQIGIALGSTPLAQRWSKPLFAECTPEWYCGSGAFEELAPRQSGVADDYEAVVDAGFAEMLTVKCGYGMENWGDVWQHGYVPKAMTWSNQEWDLVNNWVIPFVRTGDRRFLDFAHAAARHYADVDCIHYSTNPALLGAAWMHCHTSLRGHQLESPNFAHGGWVEGMLNIYHLTGDRRGLEASRGIAEYICRVAKAAERLPRHGPPYRLVIQRSAGWPLTTLSLVYRETRDPELLQTARRIVDYARRCQDPERGAWDAQVGHEAPFRGGCIFAYTLLRGLRLFADITGEERAKRDYLAAARWLTTELWRPGHRYLYEQCPVHERGSALPFLLGEMGGYATRVSGDATYAAIAWDALREYSRGGAKSRMVRDAARCQWGNGVLQQLPRMIYDWKQTGLTMEDNVTLGPLKATVRVPQRRPITVEATLVNNTDTALESVTVSALIRGDWRAHVRTCPERVAPGDIASLVIECQAPPPLAQYELQSDRAHVHLLARYRRAGQSFAASGSVRLDVAKSLEVLSPPASVALKAGGVAQLALVVTDGVAADPKVGIQVQSSLTGVSVGTASVQSLGEGRSLATLPVTAAFGCGKGSGQLAIQITSGPRKTALTVPVMVGRFRVVLIESGSSGEWRHPFERLQTYPGIAVEFMPARDLNAAFPTTAAGISGRWETVVIGDTGSGADAFASDQLEALAEFVRQGGGLMLIGGARCYTPGGYAETALRDLLPVDLADGAYVVGAIGVEVLEPEATFFEGYTPRFPDFGAHNRLRAKPGARIAARFPTGAPFLALGKAGEGRVLCLGAIWNHGSGKAFRQWPNYGRFIGRCVRWTAGDLE